ncbi:3'-5' exonuclease [Actinomadura graeca]|uniref:3'-5' exonuclease n=2 Tax=Actinomadura graeca TaxID=2750812 RepID=A0ABX8R6S3_9ACTN|nr:3'-5' exonuclease [Actinomadura graeca]
MTDWTRLRYVVVDVEGNGRQPPDLVELAAVPIVNGKIGEPQSWLVRPESPIKHFASRIHGISNRDVADAPSFGVIRHDVAAALSDAVLVAHNAHVDVGVVQRKLDDWHVPEVLDTLKLARRLLPDEKSYKLGSLVEAFKLAEDLPEDLQPHRATYDALVTARLFVLLAAHRSIEDLRGQAPEGGNDEASTLF